MVYPDFQQEYEEEEEYYEDDAPVEEEEYYDPLADEEEDNVDTEEVMNQFMPEDDFFTNFIMTDETVAPFAKTYSAGARKPIAQQLADRESSGGDYKAYNPTGGGEGAVGKYQFRWTKHKPWITGLTGVRTKEEFMANPEAQEQAFEHWSRTTLEPQAEKYLPHLQKAYPGMTLEQAMMAVHFAGSGNIEKAIAAGDFKKPLDSNGSSIHSYIFGKK